MPFLRVVVRPDLRQVVQVSPHAKLDGCTLDAITDGGFHLVAGVGLIREGADIFLADPFVVDLAQQSQFDGVRADHLEGGLPTCDSQDQVKPVHVAAGVRIPQSKGTVAIFRHDGRLELDIISREQNPQIGLAKDVAAGAVLIWAIASILIGFCLWGPKLWKLIS